MIEEESSGSRRDALHVRETIRQMGRQKISRWAAVAAVVLPIVWGASKIDSVATTISEHLTELSEEVSDLAGEVAGLRTEIAEIRGAQGRSAVRVVELTKDVDYLKKDVKDMEVIQVDLVNKMLYRTAEGKAFRARFEMIGFPVPPLSKGDN